MKTQPETLAWMLSGAVHEFTRDYVGEHKRLPERLVVDQFIQRWLKEHNTQLVD